MKDISIIPDGTYCYGNNVVCPYWTMRYDLPERMNGYCNYLEVGDWDDNGDGLLWDKVKDAKCPKG